MILREIFFDYVLCFDLLPVLSAFACCLVVSSSLIIGWAQAVWQMMLDVV